MFLKYRQSSIHFIAIMLLAFVVTSCAPKSKKSKAKFNVLTSMSVANINANGGAILYAKNGDTKWAKVFKNTSTLDVEMEFGVWDFSIVTYAGPNELSGTAECAVLNQVDIGQDEQIIDVTISTSNCASAGLKNIFLKICDRANFIDYRTSQNPSLCSTAVSPAGDGNIGSVKAKLYSFQQNSKQSEHLSTQCINSTDFYDTNLFIPTGDGSKIPPFTDLEVYSASNCSGTRSILSFTRGVMNSPDTDQTYSYKSAVANDLILALNNQARGLDFVTPSITLPMPTELISEGASNWITSSNESSITFLGLCEANIDVEIYFGGSLLTTTPCNGGSYVTNQDMSSFADRIATNKYQAVAVQTDYQGNSASASVEIAKDSTAPLLPTNLVYSGSNPTINTTVTATWDNSTSTDVATQVINYFKGGYGCLTPVGTQTYNDNTTQSHSYTINESTKTNYNISVTDVHGNIATTGCSTETVDIDNDAPVLAPLIGGTIEEDQDTPIFMRDANDSVSLADEDGNGDPITYSCSINDGSSHPCTGFDTITFNTTNGQFQWQPSFDLIGPSDPPKEFTVTITATEGNSFPRTDTVDFEIEVTNKNRAPSLAKLDGYTIMNALSFTSDFVCDDNGSCHEDIDGEVLSYSCYYDTIVDGEVDNTDLCTELNGEFDDETGAWNWYAANISEISSNTIEIKIVASDQNDDALTDEIVFPINIYEGSEAPDQLANLKVWLKTDIGFLYQNPDLDDPAVPGSTVKLWRNFIANGPDAYFNNVGSSAPLYTDEANGLFTHPKVVNFNGSNSLSIDDTDFDSSGEMTVIVYASKSLNSTTVKTLYQKGSPFTGRTVEFSTNTSDLSRFIFDDSSMVENKIAGLGSFGDNVAKCYAISMKANSQNISNEASTLNSQTFADGPQNNNDPFILGNSYNGSLGWYGAISEVRIYDKALTNGESINMCNQILINND